LSMAQAEEAAGLWSPHDPDAAWERLAPSQTWKALPVPDPSQPKPPDHTRFVCMSDTHARPLQMKVPEGDVFLHAGDFSNVGLSQDIQKFDSFLKALPHQHKVVIAGNHDLSFDLESYDSIWCHHCLQT